MRKTDELYLFEQEIIEKKREIKNQMQRSGKKGSSASRRKMMLPTDFMTRKEKREHTKAGELKVTNLFDEILTREEFDKLEDHEQRNRLQYWRSKHANLHIQKQMGVAAQTYYNYIEKLGLPKAERKKRTAKANVKEKKPSLLELAEQAEQAMKQPLVPQEAPKQVEPSVLLLNGLNIAYNGCYQAEEIRKMINKLDILLDGEEGKFNIELKIMQK